MKRLRVCLILTLALLLVAVSVAGAGGNANPGILPPDSRVQGLTYGEWSAVFWQQAFALPASDSWLGGHYGPDCFFARIGNVGLAVSGGGTLNLSCEVPAGMPLFMVVLASECSTIEPPPFYGGNEEELRACALTFVPADLQVSIDGASVENLSDYLVLSPLYEFTVPEDNFFGVPGGTVAQSISYGTWLMLAPLTPGEHTIYVYGTYPLFGFIYDATFDITVTPGH